MIHQRMTEADMGAAMARLAWREGHRPALPEMGEGRNNMVESTLTVLACVAEHGPLTRKKIRGHLGMQPKAIDKALESLVRGRLVSREDGDLPGQPHVGFWSATDMGRARLEELA